MAALMDGVALCSLPNNRGLLGIETTDKDGFVTITSKTGSISKYSLKDQVLVKSWTVKQDQKLTCPVICNQLSKEYVAVVNDMSQQSIEFSYLQLTGESSAGVDTCGHRVLRMWNGEEMVIDKGRKLKARQKIHKVLSVDGMEPLVVYHNGAVQFLSQVTEDEAGDVIGSDDSIRWCDAIRIQDTVHVVVLAVTQEKTVKAYVTRLQSDPQLVLSNTSTEVCRHMDTAELVSCCLQNSHSHPYLLSLWSNGYLCSTALADHFQTSETNISHSISNHDKCVAMATLDASHVAIVGVGSHTEDSSKDGICIVDVKYGTVQAWKPLPQSRQPHCQILRHLKYVLVPCGKTIYSYEYHITPSTLATALGHFKHTVAQDTPSVAVWSAASKNPSQSQSSPTEAYSALRELVDSKQTPNYKKFKQVFSKFLKSATDVQSAALASSNLVHQVITRCLTEKVFWPKDELRQLITGAYVSTSQIVEVIDVLTGRGELALLYTCLETITDLPEVALVQCLVHFIKMRDKEITVIKDEEIISCTEDSQNSEAECPFSVQKCTYIDKVLTSTYNDVFLLECLRKVDFGQALMLLQYLCYLLAVISAAPGGTTETQNKRPSLLQVVDWLNLTLDAHFTQLILSAEAKAILIKLHTIVESQVQFYNELVNLEGILSQLKEKCALPPKQRVGLYCIEALHIP